MGAAPLSRPPMPGSKRVVWSMCTHNAFGTKLRIVHKSHHHHHHPSSPSQVDTVAVAVGTIPESARASASSPVQDGLNGNDGHQSVTMMRSGRERSARDSVVVTVPGPLRQTMSSSSSSLSSVEFTSKMELLDDILASWGGGYANVVLLVWAVCVVLFFIAAYMSPAFWSSVLLTTPWFLLSLVIFQATFLFWVIRYGRNENHRLVSDVHALFRRWRRSYHIHVSLRRVAYVELGAAGDGGDGRSGGGGGGHVPNGHNQYRPNRTYDDGGRVTTVASRRTMGRSHEGSTCFVLVFDVLDEVEMHALDALSVGTADTNYDDDDDENDDNHDDDENDNHDGA